MTVEENLAVIPNNILCLGSEEQIKNELNLNSRCLLAVDIESDFPVHKVKTHFRMKLVEEILDGYIELRSGRPPNVHFMWKSRIDRATQVSPLKTSKTVQTQVQPRRNQNTQYKYRFKMTNKLFKELDEFFHMAYKHLSDKLLVNYHMNLYQNDYCDLKKRNNPIAVQKPVDIKLYQDIDHRRKKVSCLSWNAILSGVVAAAYARNPLICLSKRIHLEEDSNPSTENHIILIWYYKDHVRPKLYLHAKSEVTALSFCPYNENILVAGYSNGLVAVWDLTGRLKDSETPAFRTDREQQFHLLIMEETEWFRRPLGLNHIFPVLTSGYQIGHSSPVTSIAWVPPTHYISDMRHYEECEDGVKHIQFLTISLDGNKILVWDLNPEEREQDKKKRSAKSSRLSETPEALTQNISPLQKLQETFQPICKLFVSVPKSHNNNNPLLKMVMRNELYHYTAMNPDTSEDTDAVTYFKADSLAFGFDGSQKIIFSTGLGTIQMAFWEGANYKGEARDEVCKIDTLEVVHDGPIVVCELNTFLPDLLLTVGGSVFAMWDCSKTKSALVWRKSAFRYQSGMWCLYHPLSIILIRIDRCYEFWNVTEQSNTPVELSKYKGYDLMKFYGDSTKIHTRKHTFITTDALGAFKVFSMPWEVANETDEDVVHSREFINRIYERKRHVQALKDKCKREMQLNLVVEPEPELQEPVCEVPVIAKPEEAPKPKPVKISNIARLAHNQEEYMRNMEIRRKKLDLAQIEKNRLKCLRSQSKRRFYYEDNRLDGEQIFAASTQNLLENKYLVNKGRRRHKVTISEENASKLKKTCLESYEKIEQEIVPFLKSKKVAFASHVQDECQNMRLKYESTSNQRLKTVKRKVVLNI